jgi:hypothetical protein
MKLATLPPSALEKLVNQGKSIYVINTSSLPSGDKGMIVVNFYDGNQREFFKMPPTYIPMAISDAIPSKRLIESRDFKQCLLKGMLTLVTPESAEAYLSLPEAREEYDALVLSEHSQKNHRIDVEAEVSRRSRVSHHSDHQGAGPVQDTSVSDSVSNRVRGVIESLRSGDLSASEALRTLKRHQSALSQVDFDYVRTNIGDPGIEEWASRAAEAGAPAKRTAVAKKAPPAPPAPKKAAKKKDDDFKSFDFDDDGSEMTAEERAADARARAMAVSQQATNGQSRAEEEINNLLSGGGR